MRAWEGGCKRPADHVSVVRNQLGFRSGGSAYPARPQLQPLVGLAEHPISHRPQGFPEGKCCKRTPAPLFDMAGTEATAERRPRKGASRSSELALPARRCGLKARLSTDGLYRPGMVSSARAKGQRRA